jgi:hypothetical protein
MELCTRMCYQQNAVAFQKGMKEVYRKKNGNKNKALDQPTAVISLLCFPH